MGEPVKPWQHWTRDGASVEEDTVSGPTFAIEIGIGQYLDSNGGFRSEPPSDVPIYKAPGGPLTWDWQALRAPFSDAASGLGDFAERDKDGNLTNSFAKHLVGRGISGDTITLFGSIGKVASVVAAATGVIGAAVAVGSIILDLLGSGGDQSMSAKLEKYLRDQERLTRAGIIRARKVELATNMQRINDHLRDLRTYIGEVRDFHLTEDQQRAKIDALNEHYNNELRKSVMNLHLNVTWEVPFDEDEYSWPFVLWTSHSVDFWPYARPPLFSRFVAEAPQDEFGAPRETPERYPANGDLDFDHRMLVPWVSYAVEALLATAVALVPEYRSTGVFREDFKGLADRLEDLAKNMRTKLVRIRYTAEDFKYVLDRHILSEGQSFGGPRFHQEASVIAGAMDLNSDTAATLVEAWKQQGGLPLSQQIRHLHVNWMPPYVLAQETVKVSTGIYWHMEQEGDIPGTMPTRTDKEWAHMVANPQQCAKAANSIADREYSKLLLTSGYLTLVHLAALLRHLQTEPLRSETVSGKLEVERWPGASTPATARSSRILLVPGDGRISAPAALVSQSVAARGAIRTQPLIGRPVQRDNRVEYRIVLRTLRERLDEWLDDQALIPDTPESLHPDVQYDAYFHARYLSKDAASSEYVAASVVDASKLLDEHVLLEWSPSPTTQVDQPPQGAPDGWNRVELEATTFDLYNPSDASRGPLELRNRLPVESVHLAGWTEQVLGLVESIPRGELQVDPRVGRWISLGQPAVLTGEQRHPRRERITLSYHLHWLGDRLTIQLSGDPADRNYFSFLVIEEALRPANPSGLRLHSVFPMILTNQIMEVPKAFFREEAAAIRRATSAVQLIAARHLDAVRVALRPGAPVELPRHGDVILEAVQRGDLHSVGGQLKFAELAREHVPELYRTVVEEVVGSDVR
jgi:hypothetical protein